MAWIQQHSSFIDVVATVTLVFVTGFYVYLTKCILNATVKQSKLSLNPVVGIKVKKVTISEVFGSSRRNMSVGLELTNVGNAPAIEVLVDAEIELRHTSIDGEKSIPARYEPGMIPFLRPEETITSKKYAPNFGNDFILHFFDDVRESHRLNLHRIKTDPTKESFKTSRLKVFAYYRNSLGQHFKSIYEVEIDLISLTEENAIPKDDQSTKVTMIYVPRPIFHASPIEPDKKEMEIKARNCKRHLCGW